MREAEAPLPSTKLSPSDRGRHAVADGLGLPVMPANSAWSPFKVPIKITSIR